LSVNGEALANYAGLAATEPPMRGEENYQSRTKDSLELSNGSGKNGCVVHHQAAFAVSEGRPRQRRRQTMQQE